MESAILEVRFRTVIGRAYYAAFHYLSDTSGFERERTGRDHRQLIEFLATHSRTDRKFQGKLLKTLIDYRQWADYDLEIRVQKSVAEDAIEAAADIIESGI
jgi:uncharacterized protein (UPF0332 family)